MDLRLCNTFWSNFNELYAQALTMQMVASLEPFSMSNQSKVLQLVNVVLIVSMISCMLIETQMTDWLGVCNSIWRRPASRFDSRSLGKLASPEKLLAFSPLKVLLLASQKMLLSLSKSFNRKDNFLHYFRITSCGWRYLSHQSAIVV
jgi:hypothetical protein